MRIFVTGLTAVIAIAAVPARSQTRQVPDSPDVEQVTVPSSAPGQTVETAVGRVGQRQRRDEAAVIAGVQPMARIANRIQNRVQSRIRNRVDQDYDLQANATSPFSVAADQARAGAR